MEAYHAKGLNDSSEFRGFTGQDLAQHEAQPGAARLRILTQKNVVASKGVMTAPEKARTDPGIRIGELVACALEPRKLITLWGRLESEGCRYIAVVKGTGNCTTSRREGVLTSCPYQHHSTTAVPQAGWRIILRFLEPVV